MRKACARLVKCRRERQDCWGGVQGGRHEAQALDTKQLARAAIQASPCGSPSEVQDSLLEKLSTPSSLTFWILLFSARAMTLALRAAPDRPQTLLGATCPNAVCMGGIGQSRHVILRRTG